MIKTINAQFYVVGLNVCNKYTNTHYPDPCGRDAPRARLYNNVR